MEVRALIEQIRGDNTSGAAELTRRGAEVLIALAETSEARSASQFVAELLEVGKALIEAQPSMASLFNLVNATLLKVEGLREVREMKEAARAAAEGFVADLQKGAELIGEQAARLIEDGATIMTHSYSSMVLRGLLLAKARGKSFEVICTESRPICEGEDLAARLGENDIKVKLVIDAAAFRFLPQAQMVMVGADSILTQGLVNKIGTYGLAIAARVHDVPFYALCGTEKFLPNSASHLFSIETKDPGEILAEPTQNVEAINYYFDVTPLEHLTGVVTEKGILSPTEVKGLLGEMKLHEGLQC